MIKSRSVTYRNFFSEKTFFLHACAANSELPFNMSTMIFPMNLHLIIADVEGQFEPDHNCHTISGAENI